MTPGGFTARFELAAEADPVRDFSLWPYPRPRPPQPGALRGSALLFQSFEAAGAPDRMLALIDAFRRLYSPLEIVWGVKCVEGRLSWEFYFFDYQRWDRRIGMAQFLDATSDVLRCAVTPDDSKPYFLFSIDVDSSIAAGDSALPHIDVYIGHPDAYLSSGLCYRYDGTSYTLRNLYAFFDAKRHVPAIRSKLASTVRFDARATPTDRLFWPEMAGAEIVILANKREADGIYFSRITIDQLIAFQRRIGAPQACIAFAERHRDALAHQLFDVGYDYRFHGGEITILKGGWFGLL
jgi:hypothetical protein